MIHILDMDIPYDLTPTQLKQARFMWAFWV